MGMVRKSIAGLLPLVVMGAVAAPAAAVAGNAPQDTIVTSSAAEARLAPAPLQRFRAPDGTLLRIYSRHYDRAQVAPIARELGRLPHGAELARVSVYAATAGEISALCGDEAAMGCYFPWTGRMVVPGDPVAPGGGSREVVVAHEYGHHIANNRRNDLAPALSWGTKRWASYEHVCENRAAGRVFPGDTLTHYWEDPGEAFAQSYAALTYPEAADPWYFSPLLQPTPGALAKLREDVLHPWKGPRTLRWHLQARGEAERDVFTPYNGYVSVRTQAPATAHYRVRIFDTDSGRLLTHRVSRDGSARIRYRSCGHRHLRVEVSGLAPGRALSAKVARP
jgi:hypothetical protein